jgi:hypothetical protein
MDQDKTAPYAASFRDLALKTWQSDSHFRWSVTDSETGDVVGEGEAVDRPSAMVAAAETARADWGSVKWRSLLEDQ